MNAMTTTAGTAPAVGTRAKVGLGLAAFLALTDIASPFITPAPTDAENGPPMAVLAISAVLGLITIAAVVWTWRTGSRLTARITAGTRILSALGAVPAFFAGGVPAGLVVLAGIAVLLTAVSVFLILSRPSAA